MFKSIEDMQAAGKQGFDAYISSANAFNKGFQTLATEAAEFTKKSIEDTVALTEKVVASKSIEKAVELQQAHATKSYEDFMTQANKVGQFYMETAKEAYKPFEAQVEKFAPKSPK
ncbi:MAG: phasin family protein [Desulfobulbia bacterium]